MPERSEIFAPGLLEDQVVLVTGGGTGLGRATVAELVRCGACCVIAGRREEPLAEAAMHIGADVVSPVTGDVRDPQSAARMVDAALERFGRLDAVVNNAGGQYFVPAQALEPRGWQAVTRLNVGGTLTVAHAAYERAFKPAGAGTVVNTTLSPHHGLAGMAHSTAARAAVEGATRELADAWRPDGVAVSCVAPGHFETEAIAKYPDSVKRSAARAVPIGRMGEPHEHAWLVTLLCSPLGRGFTGQVLTLDGARDNWYGPWPPASLLDDEGAVPTEERR